MDKKIDKKRSIGAVAKELELETHVIRFWELKFPQIKPEIGRGKRRYYFDKEVAVLNKIKSLLYDEGYSIAGLQKLLKKRKKSDLKEQNIEFLLAEEIAENHLHDASKEMSKTVEIDDFITADISLMGSLKIDDKSTINQIISRLEFNLNKLASL